MSGPSHRFFAPQRRNRPIGTPHRTSPDRARAAYFNALTHPYRGPQPWRSALQLTGTAAAFFGCWYLALRALDVHYALTLLLALPTSGFLLRLFMIQHDCGHGSFFRSRRTADMVGHWIGVLTLIPYHYWRRTHAHHHAHNGDLERRGFGDVVTLTVDEYLERSPRGRLAYRIYRHPVVLFGIGPLWHFVLKQRYPREVPRSWTQAWRSIWLTNLCLVGVVGAMLLLVGWERLLLVHTPVLVVTCSVGVWLFYVQHQFEDTYWERPPDWDYFDAALKGSSHLALPKPLQWITASIGLHHVHHLCARIPNYRLQECMDSSPELQEPRTLRIRDTWALTRLNLWCERDERMVGFAEAERRGRERERETATRARAA